MDDLFASAFMGGMGGMGGPFGPDMGPDMDEDEMAEFEAMMESGEIPEELLFMMGMGGGMPGGDPFGGLGGKAGKKGKKGKKGKGRGDPFGFGGMGGPFGGLGGGLDEDELEDMMEMMQEEAMMEAMMGGGMGGPFGGMGGMGGRGSRGGRKARSAQEEELEMMMQMMGGMGGGGGIGGMMDDEDLIAAMMGGPGGGLGGLGAGGFGSRGRRTGSQGRSKSKIKKGAKETNAATKADEDGASAQAGEPVNDWLPTTPGEGGGPNKKRRSRGGKKKNKNKNNEAENASTDNHQSDGEEDEGPPGLYRGGGEEARWAIPEDEDQGYTGIFAAALKPNQWSDDQIQYVYALLGRQGLRDEMLASECPVTAVTKAFKLCEEKKVTKESAKGFEDDFGVVQPLPGKVAAGCT